MAKFEKRMRARAMRRNGMSIKYIAKELSVSSDSVSRWCEDIHLSPAQTAILTSSWLHNVRIGGLTGAAANKEKRLRRIAYWLQQGKSSMRHLNSRDMLMVGLGLYMGEGTKTDRKFQFTNSNPEFIVLCIIWLQQCLDVRKEDIYCNIIRFTT